MKPIITIDDIIDNLNIFEKKTHIYGLFLYRHEERTVAFNARNLVGTHLDAYDRTTIFYFLLEEPIERHTKKSWKERFGFDKKTDYWDGFRPRELYGSWMDIKDERMAWARLTMPYENSNLYKIAGLFKVKDEHIPCIIFFHNAREREVIIMPVSNTWRDGLFYDLDVFLYSYGTGRQYWKQMNEPTEMTWRNLMSNAKDGLAKDMPFITGIYSIEYSTPVGDIFKQIPAILRNN